MMKMWYIYNKRLFSSKEKLNYEICKQISEAREDLTEWDNPDPER